jgi:hypothetical protein
MSLADGVSFIAASAGTGAFAYGSARPSFLTLAQAAAISPPELVDGQPVSYLATDSLSAPTQREWGEGTFSAAGSGSIVRTAPGVTVNGNAVNVGMPLDFSVAPIVSLTALKGDIAPPLGTLPSGTAIADADVSYWEQASAYVKQSALAIWEYIEAKIIAVFNPRTVLTGNLSLYVNAATGSDSNDGSIGAPFATPQHGMDVIGQLDCAGFFPTLNIAAGTYAGFGYVPTLSCPTVFVTGAGSGVTTLTDGPNDGVINSGECIGIAVPGAALQVQGLALEKLIADDTDNIAIYVGGSVLYLAGDVKFISNNQAGFAEIISNSYFSIFQNAGSTSIVMNGKEYGAAISGQFGAVIFDGGDWQISGTPDTLDSGFLSVEAATYVDVSASYTAITTPLGLRFSLVGGSRVFSHQGPGTLGLTLFPGTLPGTCDASSSYDGFPFAQLTQAGGAPTTTDLPDAGSAGWFVDGSGNAYTAMNVAGTIKKVPLT